MRGKFNYIASYGRMFACIFVVTAFIQSFAQSFTDPRDNKTYKTVKIGSQTWMAENLDFHGEDGFLGLCYGDKPKEKIRQPENCKKYGRLYNWNEAMKACPAGWHLPTKEEWQKLSDFAGGDSIAGKKLKAKGRWWETHDFLGNLYKESPKPTKCKCIEECATDEYGFAALSCGGRMPEGNFLNFGYVAWWSSTEDDSDRVYSIATGYDIKYVYWYNSIKNGMDNVRCVQD
jgi:uncharacterized protein (TIGR02145 family)